MARSLPQETIEKVSEWLQESNLSFLEKQPGDPLGRQPVHTVYGGAHLFSYDVAKKLGAAALKILKANAPKPAVFASALGMKLPKSSITTLYDRVVGKLTREPVEDFRIDYEDGYGNRPDDEEDRDAEKGAREVARGMKEGTLPPFVGIRIKPLTEELKQRSIRTFDIFLTTLLETSGGKLPGHFVVTLPKVQIPEQVVALRELFEAVETTHSIPLGTLKMEIMVETPQAVFDTQGAIALPRLLDAGEGRVTGAHFGTYDYTASHGVTAKDQAMDHPACEFAKQVMKVGLADRGVLLSDGATNVLPIGPRKTVHTAWALMYGHVRNSLRSGFYQGWDLHPAQLPVRYAALYGFFMEGLESATERLKNFLSKAAQATAVREVFDDAATGQGLLNFFLRAHACGAIGDKEIRAAGLTPEELKTRSFSKILKLRRQEKRS